MILELLDGKLCAIEVKRRLAPKVERGFHVACGALKPTRRVLVYAGTEAVHMPQSIEAIGLHQLATELTLLLSCFCTDDRG